MDKKIPEVENINQKNLQRFIIKENKTDERENDETNIFQNYTANQRHAKELIQLRICFSF